MAFELSGKGNGVWDAPGAHGFTDAEVDVPATYLGHPDCMPEACRWYDGYRFGNVLFRFR